MAQMIIMSDVSQVCDRITSSIYFIKRNAQFAACSECQAVFYD